MSSLSYLRSALMVCLLLSIAVWAAEPTAVKKTPAERCEAIIGSLQPMMKRELRGMPPSRVDAFWRHVAEGCAGLTPQVLACIEADVKHSDEKCPELLPVLQAAFSSPDVISADELAALSLNAAQSEARTYLKSLGVVTSMLYQSASRPESFTFPPSVKATPAGDCCGQPGGKCASSPKDWAAPTWKALGVLENLQVTTGVRYRYSFTSKGKGPTATFVASAEGDPACTGNQERWQIEGHVEDGRVVVSQPTRVP